METLQRELAEIFGVSKPQMQIALKRKKDFLATFEVDFSNDRKRSESFYSKKILIYQLSGDFKKPSLYNFR